MSATAKRARLIHWNASEAEVRADDLRKHGFAVEYEPFDGSGFFRRLRERPPDAIVIDLTRRPSHGREVGLHLRRTAALRSIPIVFAGGIQEKVEAIRARLPDAVYSPWERMESALVDAFTKSPSDPIVPPPVFAEYANTPLAKKLGVKKAMRVALAGAPRGFEKTLGKLPDGAKTKRGLRGRNDLLLWFVKSRSDVDACILEMGRAAGAGGLWIIWPKRASGVATDLTQPVVREIGLGSGLVDYKVCSVDEIWTGLRFTRRRA